MTEDPWEVIREALETYPQASMKRSSQALAALTTLREQAERQEAALRAIDDIVERSAGQTGCRGCINADNRIHALSTEEPSE